MYCLEFVDMCVLKVYIIGCEINCIFIFFFVEFEVYVLIYMKSVYLLVLFEWLL